MNWQRDGSSINFHEARGGFRRIILRLCRNLTLSFVSFMIPAITQLGIVARERQNGLLLNFRCPCKKQILDLLRIIKYPNIELHYTIELHYIGITEEENIWIIIVLIALETRRCHIIVIIRYITYGMSFVSFCRSGRRRRWR